MGIHGSHRTFSLLPKGDCSHENKRCLLLGRKAMTNLDSILKNRDITLPTKVCLVKAMVFPVVMYGCESWNIKKAECQRIDAFELWCWSRLLRVPWTARRSNQSVLKAISPEYSLEGLMLKLKLWNFGHLKWRTDSLEKTLMLGRLKVGRERDDRGWDGWMASLMWQTWVWVGSRNWWWTGRPGVLQFMQSQRVGQDWVTELNWKEEQITLHSPDLNCFLSVPSRKGTWFLTLFLGLGDENKTVLYQRLWGECSEGKWLSQGCLRISITELSKGQ